MAKGCDVKKINSYRCSIFHAAAKNRSAFITRLIAERFESKVDIKKNLKFRLSLFFIRKRT
jgi:hypothetical protein